MVVFYLSAVEDDVRRPAPAENDPIRPPHVVLYDPIFNCWGYHPSKQHLKLTKCRSATFVLASTRLPSQPHARRKPYSTAQRLSKPQKFPDRPGVL
jgi:hypothetical protein